MAVARYAAAAEMAFRLMKTLAMFWFADVAVRVLNRLFTLINLTHKSKAPTLPKKIFSVNGHGVNN